VPLKSQRRNQTYNTVILGDWRGIHGEIVNLVELAIELPGAKPITDFVPYLVTNGELTDPVLEQVRVNNVTWQERGINKSLHIIQKGELFDRFRGAHGAYLPQQLEDFRTFLELILRNGAEPADKEKAARLIEHILPAEPEEKSVLDIARAASSIALLTAYISGSAVLASNHWCVFEYWVVAGAYILYLIEKSNKAELACQTSFDICEMAAENALLGIAEECAQREHLVEGFPLIDGHTYGARVTILVGLLSALDLSSRVRGTPTQQVEFIRKFVDVRLKEAVMWGESAVPYLYLVSLLQAQNCRPHVSEGLAIQMIREISSVNGSADKRRGFPNPYYSPETALRLHHSLDPLNTEQFSGFSYMIGALINFLARRWRRQAVASLWYSVTTISLLTYIPCSPFEWFRWKSSNGILDNRLPGRPQSWLNLLAAAESDLGKELPQTLVKRPAFAIWFALVYPHRFTPSVAKLIEDAVRESSL
jgi:hypothetical protein